jgi:hypothetical protein
MIMENTITMKVVTIERTNIYFHLFFFVHFDQNQKYLDNCSAGFLHINGRIFLKNFFKLFH